MRLKTAFFSIIPFLFFSIALADQAADSVDAELESMTVTATRTAKKPIETPNSIDIVTSEQMQLEDLSRTVPEALNHTTGVMVQKTSHGQGSPYIRGFTGQQTLFLIDGIKLNNSVFRSGPNQYWNTVDLFTLDHMEVLKGPGSVLYGSDAVGGTVNAITAAPEAGRLKYASPRAYYRFSSAEQSHVARFEALAALPGKVTLSGGVSPKKYGNLVAGGDMGIQEKTGYREVDGDVRLDAALSATDNITAVYQQTSINDAWRTHSTIYGKSWMDTEVGSDLKRILDQDRQLAYLIYNGNDKWGFADNITLRGSYHRQHEEEYRVKKDTSSLNQGFTVHTMGAGGQLDARSNFGFFTLGIDAYRDVVGSFRDDFNRDGSFKKSHLQGPVADEATYDDIGVFLQDDYTSGRFNAIAGLRYSHFRVHAAKVLNPVNGNQMRVDDTWNSVVGSFRTMVKALENNHLNLFAGIGQGFRAPNLSDLTRFDIARSKELEIPSPGLKPEKYWSTEIGLKSDCGIIGGNAAFFYTNIDRMIIRTPTGATQGSGNSLVYEVIKKNSGTGYVYGLENELWTHVFKQFTLEGGLTFMYGEIDGYPTSSTELVRSPITRLMPTTGYGALTWKPGYLPFSIALSGTSAMHQDQLSESDKLDTQRIPSDGTPSYYSLNLGVVWKPVAGIDVSARVDNLTNENYRIHGSGLNEPGRSFMVGVSVRY